MKTHAEPTLSFMPAPKPTAACLSTLQVAQLASEPEGRMPFADHVRGCAHCTQRLSDEMQLRANDAMHNPPASLYAALAQSKAPSRQRFWAGLGLSLAAGAAMLLLVVQTPTQDDAPMLKGSIAIFAAVQHDGKVVQKDVDLRALNALKTGDHLRLRAMVQPAGIARVTLTDGDEVTEVFRGAVPKDGWLPLGLEATDGSKSRLEVLVCETPADFAGKIESVPAAHCQHAQMEF